MSTEDAPVRGASAKNGDKQPNSTLAVDLLLPFDQEFQIKRHFRSIFFIGRNHH